MPLGRCWCKQGTSTEGSTHTFACLTFIEPPPPPPPRDALEGEGPHRRFQKRLGRRLVEIAKAVGGGYCRLQMLAFEAGIWGQGDGGWA